MINGINKGIKSRVKFTLSNGVSFELNTEEDINKANYLTSIKLNEELSVQTLLPVGINTCNVLDLELISDNKALIPENEKSIYYGYMNNTAIIEVYVTEDIEIYMGKYYVTSWKSSINNIEPNKVIISATSILGNILNMEVPSISIKNGISIKDYLIEVFNKINSKLDENKQIVISEDNINFDEFPNMQFCNLSTDKLGDCMNELSQSTLTNIFIGRENELKTDYCCDDTPQESKYYIDVLTEAECNGDSINNYDSVKVVYSSGNIKNVESLSSVSNKQLLVGDNVIDDISLGDGVYKVNRIEIKSDNIDAINYMKSAVYNSKKLSLVIESTVNNIVDIIVYGQRLDDTELVKETDGSNKLTITNKILESSYIDKYINNVLQFTKYKKSTLTVSGYITPKIQISDILYVNCTGAMEVSGYYKVQDIEWEFDSYSKATLKLVKTFETDLDLNAILEHNINILHQRLNGVDVDVSNLRTLSDRENAFVEDMLKDELAELRKVLYGGSYE